MFISISVNGLNLLEDNILHCKQDREIIKHFCSFQ